MPLLSMLLKLDMVMVWGILSQKEFQGHEGSSQGRGVVIGTTTGGS
jgi:hypothetical protein